jgi:hypothetical protein
VYLFHFDWNKEFAELPFLGIRQCLFDIAKSPDPLGKIYTD